MKRFFFVSLATILLTFSCKTTSWVKVDTSFKNIKIDENIKENQVFNDSIIPFKKQIDDKLNIVLTKNPSDLTKITQFLNTPLGNLIADATLTQALKKYKKTDFVLLNWGGIRANLPKGNVTLRSVFEIMPFENKLVVAELSGEKMFEMAEYLIKNQVPHPISRNFELQFDSKNKIKTFKIKGKVVSKNKKYFVCTTDFLLKGGDKMSFFENPVSVKDLDYILRDALIDYFRSIKKIKTKSDNRFKKN